MNLEEQVDIINIFHDGTFDRFELDGRDILFTVDIQYLAELINPNYRYFTGLLRKFKCFEFETWRENKIVNDINVLSAMNLEIASAKILDNRLIVFCYIDDGGGNLIIEMDDIIIFDEARNEITLDKLTEICRLYWGSK